MIKPLTIELTEGYTDPDGTVHKSVTIGKRLDGAHMIASDSDPLSKIPTQERLRTLSYVITKFGTLPMPTPITAFLPLSVAELNSIINAFEKFTLEGLNGREPQIISDSEALLAVGYENNGLTYQRVKFGKRNTVGDLVQADVLGFVEENSWGRTLFLIGQQITELSTEDGAQTLPGPIEIQVFEKLDSVDIYILLKASSRWGDSFRKSGRSPQEDNTDTSASKTGNGTD